MSAPAIHRFEDQGRTCVITSPRPPRHWYNYLWSEQGYCTQVSQMGHGRSYSLNAKSELCMINNQDAKYVYLRDDDTRVAWNIGEGPLNEPVENYSCAHTQSHSLIASDKDGISASWLTFVPHDAFHEVWIVRLKNTSAHPRRLSVFSAVTFELEGFKYPRYYEMYRSCETAFLPDLKRSQMLLSPDSFSQVVVGGALAPRGMPSFKQYLTAAEAEDLRAYIIAEAKGQPMPAVPAAKGGAPAT